MKNRTPTHVASWPCPGADTLWSVSIADDDGEISCPGGDDDRVAAWEMACELADRLGVPAIELDAADRETDRYEPEA